MADEEIGMIEEEELLSSIEEGGLDQAALEEEAQIQAAEEEAIELAWNGDASRYTDEQYVRAALIKGSGKSDSHLPVREPGGKLNCDGVSAAASRIGQTKASPEAKRSAAKKLVSLMRNQCGQEPSSALLSLAGSSSSSSSDSSKKSSSSSSSSSSSKKPVYASLVDWFKAGVTYFSAPEPEHLDLSGYSAEELGKLEDLFKRAAPVEATEFFQLPIQLSQAIELGPNRFKKRLFPVGRKTYYTDAKTRAEKVLDFSKDTLSKIRDNFKKGAFDVVPLLDSHSQSIDAFLGKMVDAELDDNWLYGIFETNERGAQRIKECPELPTSVGYYEDYTRKGDKTRFGPTLQHIATTFKPQVHGLGTWAPVQLSEEDEANVNVVDLSGAEFAALDDSGKESGPEVSQAPETKEEVNDSVDETTQTIQLSHEELRSLIASEMKSVKDENEALKAQVTELSESNQENTQARREQQIDLRLATEFSSVPEFLRNEVKQMLLSEMASASVSCIELSEDGVRREAKGEEKLWGILQYVAKTPELQVELGERGDDSVEPEADDDEMAKHQRILAHVKETGLSYREAMSDLAGEVTI